MSDHPGPYRTLLEELDARQNDVLGQLDELNDRIELLLKEFAKPAQFLDHSPLEKSA